MANFTLSAEIKLSRGNVTEQLRLFKKQVQDTAADMRKIVGQALDPTEFLASATDKVRRAYAQNQPNLPKFLQTPAGIKNTEGEILPESIGAILNKSLGKIPQH